MAELTGKRALVTGGSRGIGAQIAKRLATDGADVAITYASAGDGAAETVAVIEASGRKGLAIQADNSEAAAIEAAVAQVAEAFGGIDILVNNAGVFILAPINELSLDDFDKTIAINLRAVFIASKAVLAHMPNGGRIISIGSNLASRTPGSGLTAYSASKAAIIGFTRALARDLGPRRIAVTAIHPGSTDTDMNPADGEGAELQLSLMARKSYAQPSEIAGVVAFLASDAGQSVTGTGWLIDNGTNA